MIRWLKLLSFSKTSWLWIGGAAAAFTAVSVFAYTRGMDRGAASAADNHERAISALHSAYAERLEGRDEEWQRSVDRLLARIERERALREQDQENEAKLAAELEGLRQHILNLQREIYETDIGTCALSPEFDRLYERALGPATAPTGTGP